MNRIEVVARPRVSPAHPQPGETDVSAQRRARLRSVLMARAAVWGYTRMVASPDSLTILDDGTVTGPPADLNSHSLFPVATLSVPLLTTADTRSLPGSPVGDPANPDVSEVYFIADPGGPGFKVLFATHKVGEQVRGHMWAPAQHTGRGEWPAADIEANGGRSSDYRPGTLTWDDARAATLRQNPMRAIPKVQPAPYRP